MLPVCVCVCAQILIDVFMIYYVFINYRNSVSKLFEVLG